MMQGLSLFLILFLPCQQEPMKAKQLPAPIGEIPYTTLATAISKSLENVATVQANISVRTATVAKFEALKHFIPTSNLPQLFTAFRTVDGRPSSAIIFPDVTGGTPFSGYPGLDRAELNRVNMFFPLDPTGQITSLPIAEEGIRAKQIMEDLVRRSQIELAAQNYFDTKKFEYGIRTATLALEFSKRFEAQITSKLAEKQVHDVELTEAKVGATKAAVLLANFEKNLRVSERKLALVMHTSRLLVPQEGNPIPIKLDTNFHFDLEETDLINLSLIPDFPQTRGEAVERAKKQRLEVRLLVLGLKIAQLQESRDFLRLFGLGTLPISMSFKRTSPGPVNAGPATLGIIFGTLYDLPALDIGIWSNIRKSKLDVIKSQLDLEKVLLDVEEDAGNAWDRWEQSIKEYDQRTREEALALELMERQERLLAQKQSIELDVLAAKVGLYQAQANRWGGWYNLQLARLDVLRSNELLLDFIEKAGIANLEKNRVVPTPGLWTRVLHKVYASKEPLE